MVSSCWDLSRVQPYASLNAVACVGDSVWAIGDSGLAHRDGVIQHRLGSSCNFLTPFAGVLLAGGQTGELFDCLTGTILARHRSPMNCAAVFRHEGNDWAAVGTYTGEIILLRASVDGGVEVRSTRPLHANAIKGLAAGNTMLFSVDATGAVGWLSLNDLEGHARIVNGAHGRIANGCVALPNRRFASISRDRCLRIWEQEQATAFPTPHRNSIKSIAASGDGAWIATGDYHGVIALFDVEAKLWRGTCRPTKAGIAALAWDGLTRDLLAASYDGAIYRIGGMPPLT